MIGRLVPAGELDELESLVKRAFLSELRDIAETNGADAWVGDFDKFAESEVVDRLVKEAIGVAQFGQALKGGVQAMGRGVQSMGRGIGQAAGATKRGLFGQVIPTGVMGSGGKEMMLRRGGMFGGLMGTGQKMQQAGQGMRQTVAQRVAATGLKTNPQEMQQIQQFAGRLGKGDPGALRRVGSHMVESAGHHLSHATPTKMVMSGPGVLVGGALEGAFRGGGQELQRSGVGALQRAGRVAERIAPKAGVAGELLTMPAMATALPGVPLGLGAAIGGKTLSAVAPGLEHALHGIGDYAHHLGSDVMGAGVQKAVALKSRLLGRAPGMVGRVARGVEGAVS